MDENVRASINWLNEAEALRAVIEFYRSGIHRIVRETEKFHAAHLRRNPIIANLEKWRVEVSDTAKSQIGQTNDVCNIGFNCVAIKARGLVLTGVVCGTRTTRDQQGAQTAYQYEVWR